MYSNLSNLKLNDAETYFWQSGRQVVQYCLEEERIQPVHGDGWERQQSLCIMFCGKMVNPVVLVHRIVWEAGHLEASPESFMIVLVSLM